MSATILLGLRMLMALALYAFLGLIVFTLIRDLRRQAAEVSEQRFREISLVPGTQAERETTRFSITKINIGRDPMCEYILDDATVSARHASLTYRQGHWWIEDLGSKNGTFINGQILEVPTIVTDGDLLACGGVAFGVLLSQGSPGAEKETTSDDR